MAMALSPLDFELFTGLDIPDPITFVVSPKWLDRPQIYPRQATVLKVIFLRLDLFTDYDHSVVDEWEESFRRTGNEGITPGVRDRMRYLRDNGHLYFREVLLVLGRRAGKGYISALAMAYVLWHYMAKGDPQAHYGVDRDKQLACFIYAGKKDQAKQNLWKDLTNVILSGPCYQKYVARPLGESLSVYAPHDFIRNRKLETQGIKTALDRATFIIQPKEATPMSGRGPASFCLGFDEIAHVVATGATRSAEEVWDAATPSLDQFKKDAFIIEPSSPWQMIGQFYKNWENALAMDENGDPEYPSTLMLQLPSWAIYEDWQSAHHLPLLPHDYTGDLAEYEESPAPKFPKLKLAIQEYDGEMEKLEKANPDIFAVERRSHWQAVMDAYLDPKKVAAIFRTDLSMTTQHRNLMTFYKGHADPSKVNDNFSVAIAHAEPGEDGITRCVFDYIHHWKPSEFTDNTIDYIEITDRLYDLIWNFKTDEFTFDQHNSAMPIATLNKRIRGQHMPKRMDIFEKTSTAQHNWARAECFKVAINQGWVEAPYDETAELELRFLQLKATQTTNRVTHPDTGPVVHDDVATAMMECVWTILSDQVNSWTKGELSSMPLHMTMQGGMNPHQVPERSYQDEQVINQLAGMSGRQRQQMVRGGRTNAARGVNRRR